MRFPRPTVVFAGAALVLAAARDGQAQGRASGITYRIHTHSVSRRGDSSSVQETDQTRVLRWAAGRGRIDIVQQTPGSPAQTPDYFLFDSTAHIRVHPATKAYSPVLPATESVQPMVVVTPAFTTTIDDVVVRLDTLDSTAVIDGHRARLYRLTFRFFRTFDASSAVDPEVADELPAATQALLKPSRSEYSSVTDFWMAPVAGVPSVQPGSVLRRLPGLPADVLARLGAARAGLPADALTLRSTSVSHVRRPGPIGIRDDVTETTMEISDIKTTDIDLSALVLPADFVEATGAGETPPGGHDAAKWHVSPTAEH
jgi:hypothetical protein